MIPLVDSWKLEYTYLILKTKLWLVCFHVSLLFPTQWLIILPLFFHHMLVVASIAHCHNKLLAVTLASVCYKRGFAFISKLSCLQLQPLSALKLLLPLLLSLDTWYWDVAEEVNAISDAAFSIESNNMNGRSILLGNSGIQFLCVFIQIFLTSSGRNRKT